MKKKEVTKTFKSQFDRLLIIDSLLRNKKYPTTKTLAEKLELSERQVQRLIKMMQEEFDAPIIKDVCNDNGFCYGLEGFSITNIAYSENETFALQVCSNFSRRTLRGSNIYNKLDKGLTNLQNFAESYDTDEGAKLANRVQFAIGTNQIGHNLNSKQDSFEEILLNSLKEGQLLKISIRNWIDNTIFEDIGLPIFISMYKDCSWLLIYIKKDAFNEDFSSVNLSLDNLKVIDIHTITALSPYKNKYAKQVFIRNKFSNIGETAIFEVEKIINNEKEYNLGLSFSLEFLELANPRSYNFYAYFYFDKDKYVYELDTSIDYAILNSVSLVEERKNQF
ncbi:MAG: helix-turn-helix domain-containing protein [Spirochaetaceae bacterium]|nr:helix-turn-helix domain-containing protein [Spirochaetaceae bacterium]